MAADSSGRDREAVLSLPSAESLTERVGLQRMQKATQPVLLTATTPPPVQETKHAFTWPRLRGARQNGCFFSLQVYENNSVLVPSQRDRFSAGAAAKRDNSLGCCYITHL